VLSSRVVLHRRATRAQHLKQIGRFFGLQPRVVRDDRSRSPLIARLPVPRPDARRGQLTILAPVAGFTLFLAGAAAPDVRAAGYSRLDHIIVPGRDPNPCAPRPPCSPGCAPRRSCHRRAFSVGRPANQTVYRGVATAVKSFSRRHRVALFHSSSRGSASTNTRTGGTGGPVASSHGDNSVGRVAMPVVRNLRTRTRCAVPPESERLGSVYVNGRTSTRLRPAADSFSIWRFEPGGWWRANRFSLSAAPDGRSLTDDRQGGRRHQPRPARPAGRPPGCTTRAYGALTAKPATRPNALSSPAAIGVTDQGPARGTVGGACFVLTGTRRADAVSCPSEDHRPSAAARASKWLTGRTGAGLRRYPPLSPGA